MATRGIPLRPRAGVLAQRLRRTPPRAYDAAARLASRHWPLVLMAVAMAVYYWPVLLDGRLVSAADILGYLANPWVDFRGAAGPPTNTALLDSVVSLGPAMTFVRESLAAGQLPLWSPYTEFGVPFLAQSQFGTLSPVQISFLVDLWSVETAATLSGMLKIAVAGTGAYVLGRELDFSRQAALFSGLAYMFGGYTLAWLSMPDTSVTAFLPWMCVAAEWTLFGRRPWVGAAALGVAMAFAIYGGHPEVLLYQFVGFVAYAVARAIQDRRRVRGQLRLRAGAFAAAIVLSALLAAIALLPAAELFDRSVEAHQQRNAPPGAFQVGLGTLERTLDPDKGDSTIGGKSSLESGFNVYVSFYVGILGALMALWSVLVRDRRGLVFALIALLGFALSVRGWPASWLGDAISTFESLSRNHALLLWTFGLAMAAGAGVDRLQRLVARRSGETLLAPALALLLCVGVFADLYSFGRNYNPRVPKEVAGVAEPGGLGAVAAGRDAPRAAYLGPSFVRPLLPLYFDRTDIRGYGQPTRLDYEEFMKIAVLESDPGYLSYANYALAPPDARVRKLYSALNVGYFVSRGATRIDVPGAPAVARDRLYVERNPDVRPRAWLASDYEVVPNRNAQLYRLASGEVDPTRTLVLDGRPQLEPGRPAPGDTAEIVRYENQDVEIRTRTAAPQLLFLSDSHYPGWKAELDGDEVPIQRADGLFRAVSVPAGEHTVRFSYRPASVLWGFVLTLLGLLASVGLAVWGRRRTAPAAAQAPVEPGRAELALGGAVRDLAARAAPALGRVARWRYTAPVALAAAVVAYYWEVILGGQLVSAANLVHYLYPPWSLAPPPGYTPDNTALTDSVVSMGPAMSFVRDSLAAGMLPLWNPYTEFGNPFWAQSQWGLLSPVQIPYLLPPGLFSVETAQTLVGILKIAVAAGGAYLLARRFALGRAPSVFAGIAYAFGGYTTVWLSMPDTSTTVFLPWVLLGIEWVLTGSRPLLGAAGLAVLGFAALAGGHPEKLVACALLVLLYTVVRAVQERRTALVAWRLRALGLGAAALLAAGLFAVVLLPAIELVDRSVDAEQRQAIYRDTAFAWSSLLSSFAPDFGGNPIRGRPEVGLSFTLFSGPWYAGIATFLLALLAVFKRDRRTVAFLVLMAATVVVAMNTAPWRAAMDLYPTLAGVAKQHFLILWFLGLVMVGAIGLERAIEMVRRRASRAWIAPALGAVACVALFADLFLWGHEYNPRVERDRSGVPFPQELAPAPTGRGAERTMFLGFTTRPLLPMLFERPEIRGYGQPTREDYDLFYRTAITDFGSAYGSYLAYETGNLRPNALRLLSAANVGYAAESGGEFPIDRFHQLTDGTLSLHRNPDVMPRAYLVGEHEVAPRVEDAVARVADRSFDPRTSVVLDAPVDVPPGRPAGRATVTRYENNEVAVRTESERPQVLVLSDSHYPGWKAKVDGAEAEMLRANGLFRAVVVPAGRHDVEFAFQPASFRVGLGISLLSIGLLAALALVGRRIRVGPRR